MNQRGRKSLANLSVVPDYTPATMHAPPPCLTAAQGEVWKATIASRAADWFTPDTFPVLISYCKAVVEHERVSKLLDEFDTECLKLQDDEALKQYERLSRLQDMHGRALVLYARTMRLTHQSRVEKDAKGNRPLTKARPWVVDQ